MSALPIQFVAFVLTSLGLIGCAAPESLRADLVVSNARVIDGTGSVRERTHIVIDDGRIARLSEAPLPPAGTVHVDARGMTVIPGLIDLHQHLFTHLELGSDAALAAYIDADLPEYLAEYLAHGITTIKSTGDFGEAILSVRDRLARGTLVGPRLHVVGPVFTAPGGHPASTVCASDLWCRERLAVEVAEAGEAAAAVQAWAARGVDAIKLVYDGFDGNLNLPKLDRSVMEAIIEAARREGLRVTAHTSALEDARAVVQSGASGLEHGVTDRPVDSAFVDLLRARNVYYVPTLAALNIATRPPETSAETGRANFTRLIEAGVRVATGSDFGPPGLATLVELNQMVECGATPMQALQTGTRDAAAHLGILGEVGTLEIGKLADLVLLDGNPLERFEAIQQVEMTIQNGRIVFDKRGSRREISHRKVEPADPAWKAE